ncbi:hypothetical protein HDV62DRAFT_378782 [Trichoderma sp. SZMC 28011]
MYFVRVNDQIIHADFGRFIAHEASGIWGAAEGGVWWFVRRARLTPAAICTVDATACQCLLSTWTDWWNLCESGRDNGPGDAQHCHPRSIYRRCRLRLSVCLLGLFPIGSERKREREEESVGRASGYSRVSDPFLYRLL